MSIKTTQTESSVEEFIDAFTSTPQKKQDGFELLKLMKEHTGYEAKMWGPTMIGYGVYHYKSEKSRQEGDWPLVGFSPRKAAISLYIYSGAPGQEELLKQLGRFTMGKGCIYVKKLEDINLDVLKKLITGTIDFLEAKWGKQR
ncbi:MAG: DUF1801 domain-containing protein [Pedobacter sp.]|uniref:DUF1801 domain-containing protein n=1 Tax=Pedobacter sp. TaxID=1411316 RepID=UPI00356480F9